MKKYELEISDNNLKDVIEKDILGRNDKIINLIKLINNINENFTISIDGDWGCGKTFFVKELVYMSEHYNNIDSISRYSDLLKNFSNKYFIFYYNAWENDDHLSPLESIIYTILNDFPKYKKHFSDINNLFDTSKSILMNFIEKSTFGMLKKEDLNKINSFEMLSNSIQTIEEKKSALNDLINLITKKNRILLIVDELDRCKPDYAVKMLETVKHFYNNDKITTLVVTNNRQLSETVKHYYGSNFDGYGYLNKIYDTVITLKNEYLDSYAKNYCNIMKSTYLPENISVLLFHFFNFTYRECNKYMSMYRIVEPYTIYSDTFSDHYKYSVESCMLMLIAIALKIKDIKLYDDFINGKGEDIIHSFFNEEWLNSFNDRYVDWLYEYVEINNSEKLSDGILKVYNEMFKKNTNRFKFPFIDAISMLGNLINTDDSN